MFALPCSEIDEALFGFILEDGWVFALAALAAVAGESIEEASLFKSCNLAFFLLPISGASA